MKGEHKYLLCSNGCCVGYMVIVVVAKRCQVYKEALVSQSVNNNSTQQRRNARKDDDS